MADERQRLTDEAIGQRLVEHLMNDVADLERLGFPLEAADLRRWINTLREKFGMEFLT